MVCHITEYSSRIDTLEIICVIHVLRPKLKTSNYLFSLPQGSFWDHMPIGKKEMIHLILCWSSHSALFKHYGIDSQLILLHGRSNC